MAENVVFTDQQLLPLIDHLARLGKRATEAALQPGAPRPRHFVALRYLKEQGPVGQHALADALKLDPSNVVILLNELEEYGLAVRRRDPADRRRHIVALSADGEGALCRAYGDLGQIEDRLFSALDADERTQLHQLLMRAVGVEAQCAVDDDVC
jgi:DNA-binding MarR family transcriptional regulator